MANNFLFFYLKYQNNNWTSELVFNYCNLIIKFYKISTIFEFIWVKRYYVLLNIMKLNIGYLNLNVFCQSMNDYNLIIEII